MTVVRNPLTIIGAFAALAEIFGTIVLPKISEHNQSTYMWFLIVFPSALVLLFFVTLNFNHRVLYAPSDFRDESNFFRRMHPYPFAEKVRELESEIGEPVRQEEPRTGEPSPGTVEEATSKEPSPNASKSRLQEYLLLERLVVDDMATEFGVAPVRDVEFRNGQSRSRFDACFRDEYGAALVEVKMITGPQFARRLRDSLQRIGEQLRSMSRDDLTETRLVLALVHDLPRDRAKEVLRRAIVEVERLPILVEVRMYRASDLLRKNGEST
ncbi:MAG: hypothetical protein H6807_11300 [Planctomycetes bacterium]|nr:hypothetical protein [Planctomycetota bacterium]